MAISLWLASQAPNLAEPFAIKELNALIVSYLTSDGKSSKSVFYLYQFLDACADGDYTGIVCAISYINDDGYKAAGMDMMMAYDIKDLRCYDLMNLDTKELKQLDTKVISANKTTANTRWSGFRSWLLEKYKLDNANLLSFIIESIKNNDLQMILRLLRPLGSEGSVFNKYTLQFIVEAYESKASAVLHYLLAKVLPYIDLDTTIKETSKEYITKLDNILNDSNNSGFRQRILHYFGIGTISEECRRLGKCCKLTIKGACGKDCSVFETGCLECSPNSFATEKSAISVGSPFLEETSKKGFAVLSGLNIVYQFTTIGWVACGKISSGSYFYTDLTDYEIRDLKFLGKYRLTD